MADKQKNRPPVISVLGHVDHGKTSLLDYIRKANVAAGESGGITQHIGAYQAVHNGRTLTLIDTPGHEAFSAMRQRGGQAADLAILVVAADDGVMPQTKESIEHIKNAKVPFVVVVNKIDLPNANPEQVKGQLAQEGVLVEGFGGNVPIALVSAKTGQGVPELLDLLLLMADLEDLPDDPEAPLLALVIESSLDAHKGPLATVLVKHGTLKVGDQLQLGEGGKPSKVKALLDWTGKRVEKATPSMPVQVLGFNSVPTVGSVITLEGVRDEHKLQEHQTDGVENHLPILLKADVGGTLEAIVDSLPAEIELIGQGTGAINESDVLLAQTTKATIVGFRVRPNASAKKLATIEKIKILSFTTIYDLLDQIKKMVEGLIEANKEPEPTGEARVVQLFDYKGTQIVGAKVSAGIIRVNDELTVWRGEKEIGKTKVTSLRIGREDKNKITVGQECGIITSPELDIKADDKLSSQSKNE